MDDILFSFLEDVSEVNFTNLLEGSSINTIAV